MNALPTEPGSYLLVMHLEQAVTIRTGRLGDVEFPAGAYVYTGSAFGPGGLRARLAHHVRTAERPHWHVDWLRREAGLAAFGWRVGERLECAWAQRLSVHADAKVPAAGFGASDCRAGCPAHLMAFPAGMEVNELLAWVGVRPGADVLAGGVILG